MQPRIALVTGASRGIGAAVAARLARPDTHVLINYREKEKRAQTVAETIRDAGGYASVIGADLSDESSVRALVDRIDSRFGRLDTLILNASGGLERGASPDYAMQLNRDAQLRLVDLMLPLIPAGGQIVFVTSHQAHFYPRHPVPDGYAPIAHSKRAGEDALRTLKPEFDRCRIGFTVVSGDMIDGTVIIRLLQRRDPAAVDARRSRAPLPTVEEFAAAIVDAANGHASHATIYVGGADYLDRPA
ncbi:SDR family oxidoreductase [Mycobacterium sp. OTB74]|jgi:NAD(P)-dependent dehydrogenase (short-subunit alcohol dehydrogenase family)|uniref:SDR family oxidoreductase n=1 Tax=Mycobacterium sp. OTB74 TaxID=1853452 RepID=UPI0024751CE0|nr:SDR family oxidoreductase [Mycobacterium sp. OTB74]MDH6244273.1 3-oxoacyl-[acyl-carrier protein] reductase [Mycobacterium sp. OTB74]